MIHHLAKLTEHLASSSKLESAIHGIAMFSCSSGKPSRFYLGRSLNNFEISYEMAMGFDADFSCHLEYGEFISTQLSKGLPSHHSLLFLEHSIEYNLGFQEHVGTSDQTKWKSSVLMEVIPAYFAAFSMEISVRDDIDTINYFNAIRSIIALFLKGLVDSSENRTVALDGIKETQKRGISGVALTERQLLILEMIRSGETNVAIAQRLGYSESLIRQETITIYRKMGISGRKDLTIEK